MYKIGIDLGGTKIEGILLDEKYNTIYRKRIETHQENGYDSIVKSITSLINELKVKTNEDVSIGVCTPGITDINSGLIKNSNTQCLIGMSLKNDIENGLDHEIITENDANCFALAESSLGSAKGYDVVFGVIMGTGVGGGIVINGTLHKEIGDGLLFTFQTASDAVKCGIKIQKKTKIIDSLNLRIGIHEGGDKVGNFI